MPRIQKLRMKRVVVERKRRREMAVRKFRMTRRSMGVW